MILLLILTFFVIYKLYKILGREDDVKFFSGREGKIKDISQAIVSDAKKPKEVDIFVGFDYLTDAQKTIILTITKKNSLFTPAKFLNIVEKVHEMLLDGFSSKNTDKIKSLLTNDMLEKFKKIITESPDKISVNIIKINELRIQNVEETPAEYRISVYVDSKQNIKNDNEIEDINVKEILTFSCAKNSSLTNWSIADLQECDNN